MPAKPDRRACQWLSQIEVPHLSARDAVEPAATRGAVTRAASDGTSGRALLRAQGGLGWLVTTAPLRPLPWRAAHAGAPDVTGRYEEVDGRRKTARAATVFARARAASRSGALPAVSRQTRRVAHRPAAVPRPRHCPRLEKSREKSRPLRGKMKKAARVSSWCARRSPVVTRLGAARAATRRRGARPWEVTPWSREPAGAQRAAFVGRLFIVEQTRATSAFERCAVRERGVLMCFCCAPPAPVCGVRARLLHVCTRLAYAAAPRRAALAGRRPRAPCRRRRASLVVTRPLTRVRTRRPSRTPAAGTSTSLRRSARRWRMAWSRRSTRARPDAPRKPNVAAGCRVAACRPGLRHAAPLNRAHRARR